jgi:hypothetical protein
MADTACGTGALCVDCTASTMGHKCMTGACGCAGDGDCDMVTQYCNAGGTCSSKHATGACTANDQCTSGACGIAGTGNCCSPAACMIGGTCGATACNVSTGACNYPTGSTACGPGPQCGSAMLTPQGSCDGTGSCAPGTAAPCPGHLQCADASSCKTTCSVDGDCVGGYFCSGTTCAPTRMDGTGCTADDQCTNGHCVDGVCCNMVCANGCMACKMTLTGMPDGQCANVPAGQDPHSVCNANAATCTAGNCNGAGACAPAANGVQCAAISCNGSTCFGQCASTTAMNTCDGTTVGSCPSHSAPCAGNVGCASGSTTTCRAATCTVDADCLTGLYCSSGSCVPKVGNGMPCARNSQCNNNVCTGTACTNCVNSTNCSEASSFCNGGGCNQCNVPADCQAGGWGSVCSGSRVCGCTGNPDCTNPRTDTCSAGACVCGGTTGPCMNGQLCAGGACLWQPGMPCQAGGDCSTGTCTAGVCTKGAANAPCQYASDCTSGVCLAGFTCM